MSKLNEQTPHIVITSGMNYTLGRYLTEIWEHRQLLCFFIWRDVVVRYKQAILGVTWCVLRPMLTMLLFTFLFGVLARFPSEHVSYPLFVLAGMLPWQLYANATSDACSSLINNSALITKAYFPRILLPISQLAVLGLDFLINFAAFIVLALIIQPEVFTYQLAFFPLVAFWAMVLCAGSAFWLASLTAYYRDIRFLVSFFVQFGMFLSPVGYGTNLVSYPWILLYALNPMVGLIDAFRWCLLGVGHPYIALTITYSLGLTVILLFSGLLYIKRVENLLVDIL